MLAFAAALSMSVSACQDSTNPSTVLSGTYTLRTVNGQQPPVPISADPVTGTTEIVGGYIRIDRNGTFTDVLTYRNTPVGGVPSQPYDDEINGTWALSGNTIEFTDQFDPNNPYYATVSGGQLQFNNYVSGLSYTVVYAK
jgi:hypothetical protein